MTPIDFLKDTIPMYLDMEDKEYRKNNILKLLEQAEKFFKDYVEIAHQFGKMDMYKNDEYYEARYVKNK